MKHFLANCISLLPLVLGFIACMLAMGSYELDLLGLGFVTAAVLLYRPCQWVSMALWDGRL